MISLKLKGSLVAEAYFDGKIHEKNIFQNTNVGSEKC